MLPPIAQLVERETVAVTQRISLGPWFESGWVDLLEHVRQLTPHIHSRVYSSVVEQLIAAQQVGGSNPPAPLDQFFCLPSSSAGRQAGRQTDRQVVAINYSY